MRIKFHGPRYTHNNNNNDNDNDNDNNSNSNNNNKREPCKKKWPHYLFFPDDSISRLRSPVIQKTFSPK